MATPVTDSFDVPYQDAVVDNKRFLTTTWTNFFRSLYERLSPLGIERSFPLVNNQAAPADIDGLKVNSRAVSFATFDYLVQRVTTGVGATELIESGTINLTYRPTDEDWDRSVVIGELPDDAGIEFTVTADGQVQYTTSNITGTASISRVIWRMRTMAGKSALYSSQGTR